MAILEKILQFVFRKPEAPFIDEIENIDHMIYEGAFEDAIAKIEKLSSNELNFTNTIYSIYKSRILAELKDFENAENTISDALQNSEKLLNPVLRSFCFVEEANLKIYAGEINEAQELLDEIDVEIRGLKSFYSYYYTKTLARQQNLLGKIYRRKAEFSSGIEAINRSIELYSKLGNNNGTAEPYNDLGIIYATKGDSDEAIKALSKSLNIYQSLGNEFQLLKIFNNLGMIYMMNAFLDDALQNFNNALNISENLDTELYTATIKLNIGIINVDQGNSESALENIQSSLDLFRKMDNKPNIASTLLNLGNLYQVIGELGKALSCMEEAVQIYEELEMNANLVVLYGNIGGLLAEKNQHKEALKYFNKAIDLGYKYEQKRELYHSYSSAIESYTILDEIDKANEYLEKFEEIKNELNMKVVDQSYAISKAQILLKSDRVVQRAEAQKLLYEIANDEVVMERVSTDAMFILGDLLLTELKTSASEEALQEFKDLINKLETVARGEGETPLTEVPMVVKVLLLRSKLSIIDLDIKGAEQLLDEAYHMANSRKLNLLVEYINNERQLLKDQMIKYKEMVDSNASLYERLQQSQIENYLSRAEAILKGGK